MVRLFRIYIKLELKKLLKKKQEKIQKNWNAKKMVLKKPAKKQETKNWKKKRNKINKYKQFFFKKELENPNEGSKPLL
jgi:hypothetical protein